MTSTEKLKAVLGLVHHPFSEIIEDDKHPLFKCWNASHEKSKTLIIEQLPTACMGFVNTKHTVVTHFPSLIKRSYNPNDTSSSHPDAISGKKNKMAIVGFTKLDLQEQNAYDLSAQHTHGWVSYASPKTQDDHTDTITLPTSLAPRTICADIISQKNWTLVIHPPMLPFWVPDATFHNKRRANEMIMEHMKSYHPLAVRWLQIMGECTDKETFHGITLTPNYRLGLQGEDT